MVQGPERLGEEEEERIYFACWTRTLDHHAYSAAKEVQGTMIEEEAELGSVWLLAAVAKLHLVRLRCLFHEVFHIAVAAIQPWVAVVPLHTAKARGTLAPADTETVLEQGIVAGSGASCCCWLVD